MNIVKRDFIFAAIIIVVMGFFYLGNLKKLGNNVPATATHQIFYQKLADGGQRIVLEKGCVTCHAIKSLPTTHPHKEECMVCHLPK